MPDTYQAVYDAVRSKISGGDVGSAVESAIRNMNLSHYAQMAGVAAEEAAYEYMRPSVIYRPTLSQDGNNWCALYGENIQTGCVGFGTSVSKAMQDFDINWRKDIE